MRKEIIKGNNIMENLLIAFKQNNFTVTKETTKAIEFENNQSKEVVYLLPNTEITIVLSPKTVEGNEELEMKSYRKLHNTSFNHFPKRKNTGKDLIHYGYAFKFQSDPELSSFLSKLNSIHRYNINAK
jgi:hypothetical protein